MGIRLSPPAEGGIQIDDVQVGRAFGGEAQGLLEGVGGVGDAALCLAARQADDFAAHEIDGGVEVHVGCHCRKLRSSRRPMSPLRSGWNCTPARLAEMTAETKGPP